MPMNLRRVGVSVSMALICALLFGCESGSPDASAGTTSGTTASESGTATVSWTAPAADINGMSNVAGYRIHYGSAAGSLNHVIDVDNAAAVSYTVGDLAPGVWYFAVTDYDADKIESSLSGVVQVTI
jgi:fibronectin type III domain protein